MPPKGRLEEFIEHALAFLASRWNLYEKGEFAFKRTVLKLAFAEPLRYSRNDGYRTAEITFPFKVLADISTQKCGLVGLTGESSNQLFQALEEWERHLASLDAKRLGCENEHPKP